MPALRCCAPLDRTPGDGRTRAADLRVAGRYYRFMYVLGKGTAADMFGIKLLPIERVLMQFVDGFVVSGSAK